MTKKLLTLTLLILSLGTFAQERIALVIGNADYQVSALSNALNDAQDITLALENLDFKVTLVENADKRAMKDAIYEFSSKLNKDTVGLFYYAGHAVQYRGENYLIPINALSSIKELRHLEDEAVRSGIVSREMAVSQSQLNFIFLDACRDNPLPAESRGIVEGLAKSQDAKGTLIAYSTSPGRTAEDGAGRNSPYTKNLLNFINTPNQPIELMLKDVKDAVSKDTEGSQLPWYESSITGNFCFKTTNDSCAETVVNIIDNPYLEDLYDLEVIDLENGDHYVGQVKDGQFNGKGVLTYKTGAKHQGEFLDGKRHGQGKTTQLNGNSFEGSFVDDKRHGKGELSWINGAIIETEWENGIRVYADDPTLVSLQGEIWTKGYGIQKNKDDSHYLGYFINGKFNGQGTYIHSDGEMQKGQFLNGRLNGFGRIIMSNGDYYEGEFIDGSLPNGILFYGDGDYYEGNFKNNQMTGKGVYIHFDGTRYEGEFENGMYSGYGKLFAADGTTFDGIWEKSYSVDGVYIWPNGDKYQGQLKNLMKHGYGKFTGSNGLIVEGDFINNFPSGYCFILSPNEALKYEGDCLNGLSHGYGKSTYSSGDHYEGNWKEDVFHGKGKYYSFEEKSYAEGSFINGQPNGEFIITLETGEKIIENY